jgi:hypothetical protein
MAVAFLSGRIGLGDTVGMNRGGWPHEHFDAVPWDQIEAMYAEMVEVNVAFDPMLSLTRSIRSSAFAEELLGLTSMHDLVITTRRSVSPFNVIVVRSISSLHAAKPGEVQMEHWASSGRNDVITRPAADIISLFWRFVSIKFSLVRADIVEFPRMRKEVMLALAALADADYQRENWPNQLAVDDLTYVVHILFDDSEVLPEPASAVGPILIDGDEIRRLETLGSVFGPVIDDYDLIPARPILDDLRWPAVISAAGDALIAMERAGGLPWPT